MGLSPCIEMPDLTDVFCTSGSEREFTLEGWYAHETVQARSSIAGLTDQREDLRTCC